VMPAIEGGFDPDHPEIPHWEFSSEFPINPGGFELAPAFWIASAACRAFQWGA